MAVGSGTAEVVGVGGADVGSGSTSVASVAIDVGVTGTAVGDATTGVDVGMTRADPAETSAWPVPSPRSTGAARSGTVTGAVVGIAVGGAEAVSAEPAALDEATPSGWVASRLAVRFVRFDGCSRLTARTTTNISTMRARTGIAAERRWGEWG